MVWLLVLAFVAGCLTWAVLGGGMRLDDRTTAPRLKSSVLEKVADLPYPPGNIAVSRDGRVFFTYHPDGQPPSQVMELKDGEAVPYPNPGFPLYQTVLALRIDQQGRLWALDHAHFGRGRPRIMAFDLSTNDLDHRYDFPRDIAPWLSMLNDFQVSPDGRHLYIADASPIRQTPALVLYDTVEKQSRRVLQGARSVRPVDFVIHAPGREMTLFGLITLRIGVDSIALDRAGEWLYYGPVNGDRLYRIATERLRDQSMSPGALNATVEDFAPKPISDGLSTDAAGNVYITDPEHNAIHVLQPDGTLETLVQDARLRWPDGLSFGPDGWLYVTCSALHQVIMRPPSAVQEHAPYQIYRVPTGAQATPGH
jgi:sugar lactone lactonase YvrE